MAAKVVARKKIVKPVKLKKDNRKIVFVVMPFGEYCETYYEKIYRKAIEKVGLRALKVDELKTPVPVIQDIYENITKAKAILVDLTENKPNVYYELGLAHGKDIPTILIRNTTEEIPFDVNPIRILTYDKNNPAWGEGLKKDIILSLTEVNKKPSDFLPSSLLKSSKVSAEEITKQEEREAEDEERNISSLQTQLLLERERLMRREMELRNERTHLLAHPNPMRHIASFEARALISDYVKRGESTGFILSRLERLGVPRYWAEERIRELRHEKRFA